MLDVIPMIIELTILILVITLLMKFIKTAKDIRKYKYEVAMAEFDHQLRMHKNAMSEIHRKNKIRRDAFLKRDRSPINITPETKKLTGE